MRVFFICLLLSGACNIAWADVLIRFEDAKGVVNTMTSNGNFVRINGGPMPGYLLLNGISGEFFIVDPKRNEIIKVAPDEIGGMAEVGDLNVSLKTRGGREKVAGYSTGRYDLIADGAFCGSVYGSSDLMKNAELRQMLVAMRGMHKLARSMAAGFGRSLSECQRAEGRLANLVDISGFVLRYVDGEGRQRFIVKELDIEASVDPSEYELPPGMPIVDMSAKMKELGQQGQQMMQQMPSMEEMNKLMQQMQENGGQMTPEMQQQMQQMMKQMQQLQQQQTQ